MIINALLCKHDFLHYYQGFHDICSVFLIISKNEYEAFAMLERLSENHIRFALQTNLDSAQKILSLLFPLVDVVDHDLYL